MRALARAVDRARADRAQHGRARRPQRLPLRRARGATNGCAALDKLVFLGTPHHGAPLERGGNWVDILLGVSAYSAPLARIGKIRSAGITDLRFGNLVDEDWNRRDRFARSGDRRVAVPLPEGVACFAIAATTGKTAGDLSGRLLGDGIVPLASALGRHANPRLALRFDESRQWVAYGTNHLDLLSRTEVYAQIKRWLMAAPRPFGTGRNTSRA